MEDNSKEKLVKKILDAIPSHLNPVEYLMEILNISRVSVYRRMNYKAPFTYDEVVKLSLKFGFSLDEIIYSNTSDRAIFVFQGSKNIDFPIFFLNVLKEYHDSIEKQNNAAHRKATVAMNHVWLIYALGHDNIFKFFYYKYMLESSPSYYNYQYKNIVIPDLIIEERKKICNQLKNLSNTTFIIDKLVYFNTIKDIQYYYKRKLISKEELLVIKDDLEQIIDYAEKQIINGTYIGITHYFFLSYLNIYTNSMYIEYDDKFESYFYEHSIRPFRSSNPHVCEMHKKWLESLKKDSALISISNGALQAEFLGKQRGYLQSLVEDKEIIP